MDRKAKESGRSFFKALAAMFSRTKAQSDGDVLPKNVIYNKKVNLDEELVDQDVFDKPLDDRFTRMPGIKGSNAAVLIGKLECLGLKFSETREIDDGYQWDGTSSEWTCHLTANKNFLLSSLEISSFKTHKIDDVISCCLLINYEKSDFERVEKYFRENKNSKTTVGDALFELCWNKNRMILTVRACGFEKYVISLME